MGNTINNRSIRFAVYGFCVHRIISTMRTNTSNEMFSSFHSSSNLLLFFIKRCLFSGFTAGGMNPLNLKIIRWPKTIISLLVTPLADTVTDIRMFMTMQFDGIEEIACPVCTHYTRIDASNTTIPSAIVINQHCNTRVATLGDANSVSDDEKDPIVGTFTKTWECDFWHYILP